MRRRVARFNRRVTNPIQGAWASRLPPWATVVHRGRKSGTTYRTPVLAFVRPGSVTISLPYGEDADWVRNLLAAGGGELVRGSRTHLIRNPRIVRSGSDELHSVGRLAARLAGRALYADLEGPVR